MVAVKNDLEGGNGGATISSATSGSGTNQRFSGVTIGANASLVYDTTRSFKSGLLSARGIIGTTATNARVEWAGAVGSLGEVWMGCYLYLTANPPANPLLVMGPDRNAGGIGATIGLSSTGRVQLFDNVGTIQAQTGGSAFPLNQWWRLEFHATQSATNGVMDAWVYNDPDSPITGFQQHISSSTGPTGDGTNWNNYFFGHCFATNANQPAFWFDIPRVSSTAQTGPEPTPSAPATTGNFPGWYLTRQV